MRRRCSCVRSRRGRMVDSRLRTMVQSLATRIRCVSMGRSNKQPTRSKKYQTQVVIEVDEDGKYVAWCPALQACYTQGDTFEEAMTNVREVIALCLDELREKNKKIEIRYPEVIGIRQVVVTV